MKGAKRYVCPPDRFFKASIGSKKVIFKGNNKNL